MKALADDENKAMGMGKIGQAMADESDPEMADEEDSSSPEEVMAYKAFKNADTPESGATALKNFIKLCGGY